MKPLGTKTEEWFRWKTKIGDTEYSHRIYWKNGYLYHIVYNAKRVFGNHLVKDFKLEAGKAYAEWKRTNNKR